MLLHQDILFAKFLSTPSARRATSSLHASIIYLSFLSTPSARRATQPPYSLAWVTSISIHALREEGDTTRAVKRVVQRHFYPRPPRGGRPGGVPLGRGAAIFLSTPSARRATESVIPSSAALSFLSTPSARRATRLHRGSPCHGRYFYPRPPRGGRPRTRPAFLQEADISIHALREEGDSKNREKTLCFCLIIHLPA